MGCDRRAGRAPVCRALFSMEFLPGKGLVQMEMIRNEGYRQQGLYDPAFEHDACGIGAVVDIKGLQSHRTVDDALKIVEKLEHRAGKDAEGKTGDGVGILLQISHQFFQKAAGELGLSLGEARDYGVGMFFFPQDGLKRSQAKKMFEVIVEKEGMEFLGWRSVPVEPSILGSKALAKMPCIEQGFVRRPDGTARGIDFDRKLYVARRVFEQSADATYVCSLSSRTIVYKGMFLVHQLRRFYKDLQDRDYQSAIALVHSRFSTNTNPSWERATPTACFSTTERSTPYAATRIGCWPGKRPCPRPCWTRSWTRSTLSSTERAPTPPCWTTRWSL